MQTEGYPSEMAHQSGQNWLTISLIPFVDTSVTEDRLNERRAIPTGKGE